MDLVKFTRKYEKFLNFLNEGIVFFIGNDEVDSSTFFIKFFDQYGDTEELDLLIEWMGEEPAGFSPIDAYVVGDFHVFKEGV